MYKETIVKCLDICHLLKEGYLKVYEESILRGATGNLVQRVFI